MFDDMFREAWRRRWMWCCLGCRRTFYAIPPALGPGYEGQAREMTEVHVAGHWEYECDMNPRLETLSGIG